MHTTALYRKSQLIQFLSTTPVYLDLLDQKQAADAFRRCSASLDETKERSALLGCWDKFDAQTLRKAYKELASSLNQCGLRLVRLTYPDFDTPTSKESGILPSRPLFLADSWS